MRVIREGNEIKGLVKGSIKTIKNNDYSSEASFSLMLSNLEALEVGQDIEIWHENIKLFGGNIREIQYNIFDFDNGKYIANVYANDYKVICSKQIVTGSFVNTKAGSIVKNLITNYLSKEGMVEGIIQEGINITDFSFICNSIYEILDKLAEECGYIWFIDENKNLHFLAQTVIEKEYHLKDMKYNNFKAVRTIRDYRNKQYVKYEADGYVKFVNVEDTLEISNRKTIEGGTGIYANVYESSMIKTSQEGTILAQNLLIQNSRLKNEISLRAKGIYDIGKLIIDKGFFAGTYLITRITVFDDSAGIWSEIECKKTSEGIKEFASIIRQNKRNNDNVETHVEAGYVTYSGNQDEQLTINYNKNFETEPIVTASIVFTPTNIALNKYAEASSYAEGYMATKAVNGINSDSEAWVSRDNPYHWLMIDFETVRTINKIILRSGYVDDTGAISSFLMQYWDDALGTWNDIPGTNISDNTNANLELNFQNIIISRIRIFIYTSGVVRIRELEVYEALSENIGILISHKKDNDIYIGANIHVKRENNNIISFKTAVMAVGS